MKNLVSYINESNKDLIRVKGHGENMEFDLIPSRVTYKNLLMNKLKDYFKFINFKKGNEWSYDKVNDYISVDGEGGFTIKITNMVSGQLKRGYTYAEIGPKNENTDIWIKFHKEGSKWVGVRVTRRYQGLSDLEEEITL